MKRHYCDIEGCKEEAYNLEVQVCSGYKQSTESTGEPKIVYKPFEVPRVSMKDLCNKHFEKWCRATYKCFWGKVKNG
jgi:hypothetical protein